MTSATTTRSVAHAVFAVLRTSLFGEELGAESNDYALRDDACSCLKRSSKKGY